MNSPSPPPPLSTTTHIPTPSRCYVDFCLVPVGTSTPSVALEVAAVQRLLLASGLKCTMHSAGTTVEGSWDEVMRVVGQAHAVVHAMGVVRVQTSMRVGTRTDKEQTAEQKVQRVEEILAQQQQQQQQDDRPT
ncbi:YkoF-like protein [Schizothecium vesticola]|uniref:YkoF-like protein n=1 Tax=Schizothecium vesticola TaxID=314040 RepID=A0AA40BQA3_9PEZI|nr:YkoF-like protein [Schizothecium vesticola]